MREVIDPKSSLWDGVFLIDKFLNKFESWEGQYIAVKDYKQRDLIDRKIS